MADVTISQLTQGTPAGSSIIPYSTGTSTLGVPASAVLQNAGDIRIGGKLSVGDIGPVAYQLELRAANPNQGIIGLVYNNDLTGSPKTGAMLQFTQANVVDWAIGQPSNSSSFSFYTGRNYLSTGVERMRIDSNGVVTIPFQPAFHVWNQTNQTLTNNTVMSFNATSSNVSRVFNQGGHYANNRFTAPVAGVYQFSANVLQNSTNRGSYWGIGLVFNGIDTIEFSYAAGTLQQGLNVSATIKLAANDYIDVRASTDGAINIDNSGTFSGHLVG